MQNTSENIDTKGLIWTERKFAHPDRTIRLGTSFSGIGAIEHAFQRLGLKTEILFAGDIEPNCKKAYFANYEIEDDRWHTDIHNFDAKPYRNQVDLFVGGAPCQAFSFVGARRGFEDTRGTLFREFARVVKECQPKVFIFENVAGLFEHDGGRTWDVIRHTFEDYCGYDVHFQLLNSKNYGIPQHRERLYCVGFRKKTNFLFPAPIPLQYRMYDFLEDWVDTKYYDVDKSLKILSPKGDYAEGNEAFNDFVFNVREVDDKYYLSEKVAKYVLAGGTKNFRTSTKTDLDIARPLLQSMHKMHRACQDNYFSDLFIQSHGKLRPSSWMTKEELAKLPIRKLTPEESFKLQGFPAEYASNSRQNGVADGSLYKQAGNAVSVNTIYAVLHYLLTNKIIAV